MALYGAYLESDLEASLKRAFVNGKADYIILDSRRGPFLWAGVKFGMERGWLAERFVEIDEQSSQLQYRLTDEGKRHFGVV